jgi:HEPN domain-containing protein
MNSREKYEYWLEAARYDLESARVMLNGGRYMYVAFMSQQAIEKLVKGIYTLYTDDDAPMIHNIWSLFRQLKQGSKLEDFLNIEEFENGLAKYKNFFVELLSYYISGRYPTFKEKISSSIDANRSKKILATTEEAFAWIESLNQYKK